MTSEHLCHALWRLGIHRHRAEVKKAFKEAEGDPRKACEILKVSRTVILGLDSQGEKR